MQKNLFFFFNIYSPTLLPSAPDNKIAKKRKRRARSVKTDSEILTIKISIFSPLLIPFVPSRDSKRQIVNIYV